MEGSSDNRQATGGILCEHASFALATFIRRKAMLEMTGEPAH